MDRRSLAIAAAGACALSVVALLPVQPGHPILFGLVTAVVIAALVAGRSLSPARVAVALLMGLPGLLIAWPALAAEGASVTVPWGLYATELAHIAAAVLTPLALTAVSLLPLPIRFAIQAWGGERLIRNAVDYGLNAVEGAAKDKVLTVPVGSEVLATSVQYALDRGAPWLVRFLGGPDGIREKVFRALRLEEHASAAALRVS